MLRCFLFLLILVAGLSAQAAEVRIRTHDEDILFHAEIADTPEKAARGLMFRTDLAPDVGMLFISDTDRIWHMWMKNTFIGLDMLFIEKTGIITKIISNTSPLDTTVLSSDIPVKGVLEIKAGQAEKLNIHVGDRVLSPYFN